ncbi:chorion peroxidase-like [Gordionus sp. m RMFG-2023]|uniref:chorion peroxidase-like n=1 Tax=Gordionus sp. m RMFG-2023 TaxID=3053472 RepID=UPI0031FDA716
MDKNTLAEYLHSLDLNSTVMESECPYNYDPMRSERKCSFDQPYREIDGFCNNIKYPFRGSSNYPAQRFIPADYGDGLNEPRRSVKGEELPNARIISNAVLQTNPKNHSTVTNMMMIFGLLMDHEVAFASSPTGFMFGNVKCCNTGSAKLHPLCMKMDFPEDDAFFGQYKVTCMEVVRSLPAIDTDCPRNQNNDVTSYIDGSPIYGSTIEVNNRLRAFSRGELKVQQNSLNPRLKTLMPIANISTTNQCEMRRKAGPYKCFAAGDARANENSLLIVFHTLFFREHNRIAQSLQKINPRWNDERLYQESRRILIAEIQHICFKEFIPILLGQSNLEKFGLGLKNTGYFVGYNQEVDASVDHGFVTAAFRFGHSLIKNGFDCIELLRGREQGVPSYNEWREFCGLLRYRNWDDMRNHIIPSAIDGMRATYENVDDVDIFIGGVAEIVLRKNGAKESDGILGPTFSCIIGNQYKNFRYGDRFWYENDNSNIISHAFTPRQLQEIRKVRLSRVICDNSYTIDSISRNVFIKPDFE